MPWSGRDENKADTAVWAVTCFIVRRGYRGRGFTYSLVVAAVEHARSSGARAIEGYPMIAPPGKNVSWGEMHVGSVGAFEAAGFDIVSQPSKRRLVLRRDLT
jgi:GNAT superfamily N-acetyltransferase